MKKLTIATIALAVSLSAPAFAKQGEEGYQPPYVDDVEDQGYNVDYQDKNITNYQDPYAGNPRAYKSNEEGIASEPPTPNMFSTISPAPMKEDVKPFKSDTKSFLGK